MNPERLLRYFNRIAEAPDAIPRLRRFILDLAVRGKLVEQDPNDEPTAELLKRIEAEKVRLVKKGSIQGRARVDLTAADEEPFELPAHWQWVRFGEIVNFFAGRTPSRYDPSYWNTGHYPWVSIADMVDGGFIEATKESISEKAKIQAFGSEPLPVGTMIMSFKLTIGKVSRLGITAFHNEAIISIQPYLPELDGYLFKVLPIFAPRGNT